MMADDITARVRLVYDPGNSVKGFQGDINKIIEATKKGGREQVSALKAITDKVAVAFKPGGTDALLKDIGKVSKALGALQQDLLRYDPQVFTEALVKSLGTTRSDLQLAVGTLAKNLGEKLSTPLEQAATHALDRISKAFKLADPAKFIKEVASAQSQLKALDRVAQSLRLDLGKALPSGNETFFRNIVSGLMDFESLVKGQKGLGTAVLKDLGEALKKAPGLISESLYQGLAGTKQRIGVKSFSEFLKKTLQAGIQSFGTDLERETERGNRAGILKARKGLEDYFDYYKRTGFATAKEIALVETYFSEKSIRDRIKLNREYQRLPEMAGLPGDKSILDANLKVRKAVEETDVSVKRFGVTIKDKGLLQGNLLAYEDRLMSLTERIQDSANRQELLRASAIDLAKSLVRLNEVWGSLDDKERKRSQKKPGSVVQMQEASQSVLASVAVYEKLGGTVEAVIRNLGSILGDERANLRNITASVGDDILSIAKTQQTRASTSLKAYDALRKKFVTVYKSQLVVPEIEERIKQLRSASEGVVIKGLDSATLNNLANLQSRAEGLKSIIKDLDAERAFDASKKIDPAKRATAVTALEKTEKEIQGIIERLSPAARSKYNRYNEELKLLTSYYSQAKAIYEYGEGAIRKLIESSKKERIKSLREDDTLNALRETVRQQLSVGRKKPTDAAIESALMATQAKLMAEIVGESRGTSLRNLTQEELKTYEQINITREDAAREARTIRKKLEGGRYLFLNKERLTIGEITARQASQAALIDAYAKFWQKLKPEEKVKLLEASGAKVGRSQGQAINELSAFLGQISYRFTERAKQDALDILEKGMRKKTFAGRRVTPEVEIPKELVDPFEQELYNGLAKAFAQKKGKLDKLVDAIPESGIRNSAKRLVKKVQSNFSVELAKKGILVSNEDLANMGYDLANSVNAAGGIIRKNLNKLNSTITKALQLNTPEFTGRQTEDIIAQIVDSVKTAFNKSQPKFGRMSDEAAQKVAAALGGLPRKASALILSEIEKGARIPGGGSILPDLMQRLLSGRTLGTTKGDKLLAESGIGKQLSNLLTEQIPKLIDKETKKIKPGSLESVRKLLTDLLTKDGGLLPDEASVKKVSAKALDAIRNIPEGLGIRAMVRGIISDIYKTRREAETVQRDWDKIIIKMSQAHRVAARMGLEGKDLNAVITAAANNATLNLLVAAERGREGAFEEYLRSAKGRKNDLIAKKYIERVTQDSEQAIRDELKSRAELRKRGGVPAAEFQLQVPTVISNYYKAMAEETKRTRPEQEALLRLAAKHFREGAVHRFAKALSEGVPTDTGDIAKISTRGTFPRALRSALDQLLRDIFLTQGPKDWTPDKIRKVTEEAINMAQLGKAQAEGVRRYVDGVVGPMLKEYRAQGKRIEQARKEAFSAESQGDLVKLEENWRSSRLSRIEQTAKAAALGAGRTEEAAQLYGESVSRLFEVLGKRGQFLKEQRLAVDPEKAQKDRDAALFKLRQAAEAEAQQYAGLAGRIQELARKYRPEDLKKIVSGIQAKVDLYNTYLSELRSGKKKAGGLGTTRTGYQRPEQEILTPEELALLGANKILQKKAREAIAAARRELENKTKLVRAILKEQERSDRQIAREREQESAKAAAASAAADAKILSNTVKQERKSAENLARAREIARQFAARKKAEAAAAKAAPTLSAEPLPETVVPAPAKVEAQVRRSRRSIEKASTEVTQATELAAKKVASKKTRRAVKALSEEIAPNPEAVKAEGGKAAAAIAEAGKTIASEHDKIVRKIGGLAVKRGRTRPEDSSWLYGLPDNSVLTRTVQQVKERIDWGARDIERWASRRRLSLMGVFSRARGGVADTGELDQQITGTVSEVKSKIDWGFRDINNWISGFRRRQKSIFEVLFAPAPTGAKSPEAIAEEQMRRAVSAIMGSVDRGAKDIEDFLERRKRRQVPLTAATTAIGDAGRRLLTDVTASTIADPNWQVLKNLEKASKLISEISAIARKRKKGEPSPVSEADISLLGTATEYYNRVVNGLKEYGIYADRAKNGTLTFYTAISKNSNELKDITHNTGMLTSALGDVIANLGKASKAVDDYGRVSEQADKKSRRPRIGREKEESQTGTKADEAAVRNRSRIIAGFETQLSELAQGSISRFGNIDQYLKAFVKLRERAQWAFKGNEQDATTMVNRISAEMERLVPLMESRLRRVNLGKALEQQFGTLDQRLNQLSYRFQHVSWQLSLLGGLGVAAFTKAIQAASKFEGEVAPIAAVIASNNKELERFDEIADRVRKTSMDMATQTVFSTTEINQALQALSQTGLKEEEIFQVLGEVLQFAAAGNLKLDEAVRSSVSAMTAFNLRSTEMATATRAMTSAALLTNANVQDMAEAFKHVGPVASMAGMGIEATAAAVGRLSQTGIRGSMAGTGLKRAISELIAPTGKATKLLKALGVEAVDPMTKTMRSMPDIIDQFTNAFARLGPTADRTGIIMQIFGMRAGPAMAALIEKGSAPLRQLQDDLEKAADQAEIIANKRAESLEGLFKRVGAAFNNLRIVFGEAINIAPIKIFIEGFIALLDVLTKIARDTKFTKWLIAITLAVTAAIAGLMALVGAATMVTSALAGVAALLATIQKGGAWAGIKGLMAEIKGMFAIGPALKEYSTGMKELSMSQKDMLTVMRAMRVEEKVALEGMTGLTAAEKNLLHASRQVETAYRMEALQAEKLNIARKILSETDTQAKIVLDEQLAAIERRIAATKLEIAENEKLIASERALTAAIVGSTEAKKRDALVSVIDATAQDALNDKVSRGAAAKLAKGGFWSSILGWFKSFGKTADESTSLAAKGLEKAGGAAGRFGKIGGKIGQIFKRGIFGLILGGPVGAIFDIILAVSLIESLITMVMPLFSKKTDIDKKLEKFEKYKDTFKGKEPLETDVIVKMSNKEKEQYQNDAENYAEYWKAKVEDAKNKIETMRSTTLYVPTSAREELQYAEEQVRLAEKRLGILERASKMQTDLNAGQVEALTQRVQDMLGKTEGVQGIKGLLDEQIKSFEDIITAYSEVRDHEIEMRKNAATTAIAMSSSLSDIADSAKSLSETFYTNFNLIQSQLGSDQADNYRRALADLYADETKYYNARIERASKGYQIETAFQSKLVSDLKMANSSRLNLVQQYMNLELGTIASLVRASNKPELESNKDVLEAKRIIYSESLKSLRDYYKAAARIERDYSKESSKIQQDIVKSLEAARKRRTEATRPTEEVISKADESGIFMMLKNAESGWNDFYTQLERRNQYLRQGQWDLAEAAQQAADSASSTITAIKNQLINKVYSDGSAQLQRWVEEQTNIGRETGKWLKEVKSLNNLSDSAKEKKILDMLKRLEAAEETSYETAADVGRSKFAANEELRNINLTYLNNLSDAMKSVREELTRIAGIGGFTQFGVPIEDLREGAAELSTIVQRAQELSDRGEFPLISKETEQRVTALIEKVKKAGEEKPAEIIQPKDSIESAFKEKDKGTEKSKEKSLSATKEIETSEKKSVVEVAKARDLAIDESKKKQLAALEEITKSEMNSMKERAAAERALSVERGGLAAAGGPEAPALSQAAQDLIKSMDLSPLKDTFSGIIDKLRKVFFEAELKSRTGPVAFQTQRNLEREANTALELIRYFSTRRKEELDRKPAPAPEAKQIAELEKFIQMGMGGAKYSLAAAEALAKMAQQPGVQPEQIVRVELESGEFVYRLKSELEATGENIGSTIVRMADGTFTNTVADKFGKTAGDSFVEEALAKGAFKFEPGPRQEAAVGPQRQPTGLDLVALTAIDAQLKNLSVGFGDVGRVISVIGPLEQELLAQRAEILSRQSAQIRYSDAALNDQEKIIERLRALPDKFSASGTALDNYTNATKTAFSSMTGVSEDLVKLGAYLRSLMVNPPTAAPVAKGRRTGGQIGGYGGGDIVPALLEPGEFVLRKEAVKKYGAHRIAAINDSAIPRFQEGGLVKNKWWEKAGAIDSAIKNALIPTARPLESDLKIDSANVLNNAAKSIAAMVYETFTNPSEALGSFGQIIIGGYNSIVPTSLKIPGQQESEGIFKSFFKSPDLSSLYENPLGPAMAVGLIGSAMTGAAGVKAAASESSLKVSIADAIGRSMEPVLNDLGGIDLGLEKFGRDNRPGIIAKEVSSAIESGLTKFDISITPTTGRQGSPIYEITGGRSLGDLVRINQGQEAAVYTPKINNLGATPSTVTKIPYPKETSPTVSSIAESEARYQAMIRDFLSRDKAVGSGTMRHIGFYEAGDQKIPIFEQKYFEGRAASELMVDKYMSDRGYVKSPPGSKWEYERVEGDKLRVVGDLIGGGPEGRSKNVLFTKDGTIEVVDSLMKLVKKAQVDAMRASGKLPKFAEGGAVDGYGGGDIVPAMLEPGEYVSDKQTVRFFGREFFEKLKAFTFSPSVRSPQLQQVNSSSRLAMASGGLVPSIPSGPTHSLSISVQNKTFKVQGAGDQIKGLMAALNKERLTTVGS